MRVLLYDDTISPLGGRRDQAGCSRMRRARLQAPSAQVDARLSSGNRVARWIRLRFERTLFHPTSSASEREDWKIIEVNETGSLCFYTNAMHSYPTPNCWLIFPRYDNRETPDRLNDKVS